MRESIKLLVTALLERKAFSILSKQHSKIIIIIGSRFRAVFKEEMAKALSSSGLTVEMNKPGHNYLLGTALTILGVGDMATDVWGWVKLVISSYSSRILPNILIIEFSLCSAGDLDFLRQLKPSYIVISDTELLTPLAESAHVNAQDYHKLLESVVNNFCTQSNVIVPMGLGEGMKAVLYGNSEPANLRLGERFVDLSGQKFEYFVNGIKKTGLSKGLGEANAYAQMIAAYVVEEKKY